MNRKIQLGILSCALRGCAKESALAVSENDLLDPRQMAEYWRHSNACLTDAGDTTRCARDDWFALTPSLTSSSVARFSVSRVELVVAYCSASLKELALDMALIQADPYLKLKRVTIYSKCGVTVNELSEMARQTATPVRLIHLSNVGRCDHTYAHHLATHYDRFEDTDVIVFVKDSHIAHSRGRTKVSLAQLVRHATEHPVGFACGRYMFPKRRGLHFTNVAVWPDMMWMKMTAYKHAWDQHTRLREKEIQSGANASVMDDTTTVSFEAPDANLGRWILRLFVRALNEEELYVKANAPQFDLATLVRSPVTRVCLGGVFAAKTVNVRSMPRALWNQLAQILSRGDNIEEGHFAERSWAMLLSPPPTEAEQSHVLCHHFWRGRAPHTRGIVSPHCNCLKRFSREMVKASTSSCNATKVNAFDHLEGGNRLNELVARISQIGAMSLSTVQ